MKNELRVWLSILLMISALLVLTTMMDGDIFRSIGYFFLALVVGTPFSFPLLFCSLTAVDLLLHPVLERHHLGLPHLPQIGTVATGDGHPVWADSYGPSLCTERYFTGSESGNPRRD